MADQSREQRLIDVDELSGIDWLISLGFEKDTENEFSENGVNIREGGGDQVSNFPVPVGASAVNLKAIDKWIDVNPGYVTRIKDPFSGKNFDASGTLTNQPDYNKTAINNKPGWVSEEPVSVAKLLKASSSLNITSAATYFMVIDYAGSAGSAGSIFFANHDTFAADTFLLTPINSAGNKVYFRIRDSAISPDDSLFVSLPIGKYILRVECDGANNIKLYANGKLTINALNPTGVPIINHNIAGGFANAMRQVQVGAFAGKTSKFCVCRDIPSAEEINEIEAFLNSKFNIY
jgi:hypothetical protein